jgi:hypothetical protein
MTLSRWIVILTIAFVAGYCIAACVAHAQPAAPIVTAPSFPVPLTAQDSANLNQVCTYAMDNGTINLQTKTAIGQFCLDVLNRIGQAQAASKSQAPSAPPPSEAPK